MTDDAIEAVRRVIKDLRPGVLDQLGVWEALEWYANQIEARSNLVCECVIDSAAAELELDPDRSTMLFRIVQDSLTNVLRHAEASCVSIQAWVDGGEIMLEMRDDGKGFDVERVPEHPSLGILGMRERARHFGGQLSVRSEAGRGTIVVLCLPVGGDSSVG